MTVKQERKRAFQEFSTQLPALRAKWPKTFPENPNAVRPIVTGVFPRLLCTEFGWSWPYASAIIQCWKLRPDYCRAVLAYPKRFDLDGIETEQETGDHARADAAKRLAEIAARKERQRERALATLAQAPAAVPAPPVPALTPAPEPPPAPAPAPPEATAAKPGKLVLSGSAAMKEALQRRLAPIVAGVIEAPAPRRLASR